MDEPSTQEPACVVRDPLNGKTALREACASLLRGEPYGDLDPSQRLDPLQGLDSLQMLDPLHKLDK